jgi:hypothetical protein
MRYCFLFQRPTRRYRFGYSNTFAITAQRNEL